MQYKTVHCLYCDKELIVSARAFSVNCPGCNQRLNVENLNISSHYAAKIIETCGSILVEAKGELNAQVRALNLHLDGKQRGNVIAEEKVFLAESSSIQGDITAKTLEVQPGAKLQGFCRIGPTEQDED